MPHNFKSPKVFISYSHDTPEHMDRVLELSGRLRNDGIDCTVDQYEISPSQGWPRWTEDQIERSDYTLVICTERYKQRFRLKEAQGQGLGVKWEGAVITQELYDAEANNTKFIPVVFSPDDAAHIPSVLRGMTRYDLSAEGDYVRLYRHVTNQPSVLKPMLGRLRPLPPRERRQGFRQLQGESAGEADVNAAERGGEQVESDSQHASEVSSMSVVRRHLATFIQIVIFLFAAFGGFLDGIAPPDQASPKFAVRLGSFLVIIVLLIVSAISKSTPAARFRRRWIWAGVVCSFIAVIAGLFYPYVLGKFTYVLMLRSRQ